MAPSICNPGSSPIDLFCENSILGLAGDDVVVGLSQNMTGSRGRSVCRRQVSNLMKLEVDGKLLYGDASPPTSSIGT